MKVSPMPHMTISRTADTTSQRSLVKGDIVCSLSVVLTTYAWHVLSRSVAETKVMWFGKKNASLSTGVITTSEGLELQVVTSYKYLGVCLGGTLSFSQHISKLQAEVKSRLGFL